MVMQSTVLSGGFKSHNKVAGSREYDAALDIVIRQPRNIRDANDVPPPWLLLVEVIHKVTK